MANARDSVRTWHRTRVVGRRLVLGVAVAGAALLAGAPAASASLEPAGEFAPPGGQLKLSSAPQGLAVNQATGDLYEADGADARVLRFDKEGKLLEGWGWGVGNGEDKYERCGPEGEKNLLNEPLYPNCLGRENGNKGFPGDGNGQFEEPRGVAIDPTTGNVLVADADPEEPDVLQEFTADGTYITRFAARGEGGGGQIEDYTQFGLAVDSAGRVYVVDNGAVHGHRVVEFERGTSGEYEFKRELFTGRFGDAPYLAVDDQGRFYITDAARIYRFDSATAATPSWQSSPEQTKETEAETVIPTTGELIFYSSKQKQFHLVKPVGSSEVVDTPFKGAEGQTGASAGAFDGAGTLPGHPAGIFYTDEPFNPDTKSQSRGLIFAPSAKLPPVVEEEAVQEVGARSAKLSAVVNPKGLETRYRFEYGSEGPCSVGKCAEVPGSGTLKGVLGVGVSVELSHLAPETPYYFRVVVENEPAKGEVQKAEGEDKRFGTYPALEAGLPDGRAYELVSPADKHGGEVFPARPEFGSCEVPCEPGLNSIKMPEQSAPDGESVVYEGYPVAPETEGERGTLKENEYRAVRTPSGWQTKDLSLERETKGFGFRAFTSDLRTAVLQESEEPLAEGSLSSGYEELYLRDSTGGLTPLVRELVEPFPARTLEMSYAGGSSDLARLVFEANEPLTAATSLAPQAPPVPTEGKDIYEWSSGTLRLVNALNAKSAAPGSVLGSAKLLAIAGTGEPAPDRSNAVSSDGSKVFWTSLGSGKLYVREGGEKTREIGHSGRCRPGEQVSERVCFLTASTDGTKVLLSDGSLYDTTIEPITRTFDLTKGHHGFEGIAGASSDLSRIYFVDNQVINPVQGPLHTAAQTGQPNLYEYESGAGAVRFIATLTTYDNHHGPDHELGTWVAAPQDRMAQVTSNGRFLAFDSVVPLTGYNSTFAGPVCVPEEEAHPCGEVFEYDSAAKSVRCVSCNPTGLSPAGPSTLSLLQPIVSRYPQPHSLTPSGRLFFDSFDALTASDQAPGVENVYEYEPEGQGGCTRTGGCTFLLSSGRGKRDASFLSADETGKNVFFTTRQQLLPEDQDELVDLYDAREGGGFERPPTPPAPCVGDACRPPSSYGPGVPPPASSTFSGPGNLVTPPGDAVQHATVTQPAKCPKGKVRRHGKCVPAPKKCPKGKVRRHGKCVKAAGKKASARPSHATTHQAVHR